MLEAATEQLATITGQKPNVRRARKSIAQFKLREGMPVGVAVTLRGERAYEFLDRLMSVAIPRIRDFRGLNPRSFDGRGNYSMGVREQIIFPEIDYDEVDQVRGLDITITTTASSDEEAFALLEALGMPFRERRPAASRPRSATRLKEPTVAKTLTARPPAADAELQDPGLHPLPPLRPCPLGVPQVRRVPDLPARARAQRLHPRHDEVELVTLHVDDRPDRRLPHPPAQRRQGAAPRRRDPVLEAQARAGADPQGAGLHRGLRGPAADRRGARRADQRHAEVHERPQAGDLRAAARLASRPAHLCRPRAHPPDPGRDGHGDHLHLHAAS